MRAFCNRQLTRDPWTLPNWSIDNAGVGLPTTAGAGVSELHAIYTFISIKIVSSCKRDYAKTFPTGRLFERARMQKTWKLGQRRVKVAVRGLSPRISVPHDPIRPWEFPNDHTSTRSHRCEQVNLPWEHVNASLWMNANHWKVVKVRNRRTVHHALWVIAMYYLTFSSSSTFLRNPPRHSSH